MKYLFFLTGFLLFLIMLGMTSRGAIEGWNADSFGAAGFIGVALMASGVGIHIYDNWASHQR